MSVAITVSLSPSALRLSQQFKAMPETFPRAIQRGMTRALLVVSGRIQEKRLTGKGPFPAEQHRLGEVTGQLKLRTRSTPARIVNKGNQTEVVGAIGSPVFYAGFQEYGTSRLPARAPFRTGINENMEYISDEIEKEVVASLPK